MRSLVISLILLLLLSAIEVAAAVLSHSLSLFADLAHVFSDVAALSVAFLVQQVAQAQQGQGARLRAQAAVFNSVWLLVLGVWIACEAIGRLTAIRSPEIAGLPMLLAAGIGAVLNTINASCLHSSSLQDLNFRGAFLHAVADLLTSLGTVATAITVMWLHWNWTDGAMSLLIAVLISWLALSLLSQSLGQLRDSSLRDRSLAELRKAELQRNGSPHSFYCNQVEAEKLLFPSLQELIQ